MRGDDAAGKTRSHRRAPLKLSATVGRTARELAAGRGLDLLSLATRWRDIVGDGLATHCRPASLTKSRSGGAILTLSTEGGAALLVQHQQREIIARVNAMLGPDAITSIKLIQTSAFATAAAPPRPKPRPPVLAPHEEDAVRMQTQKVADPDLRDRLTRLMRHAVDGAKRR
jgi:hypothetical protein